MTSRVQFIISGKFLGLLLLAAGLLAVGYYWRGQQQQALQHAAQIQERFKAPPYFVNRGASVFRSCQHCLLTAGKLKPQNAWKVWGPEEIPAVQQRWFLAVEDPPLPVTVSGVLMLPAYPALNDNPALGFDETRVVLVFFQNLERKNWIEQAPPRRGPSALVAAVQNSGADEASRSVNALPPLQSPFVGKWKNTDPYTKSLTRLVITQEGDHLVIHAWAKCPSVECDWGDSPPVYLRPVSEDLRVVWDHNYALHYQEVAFEGQGYDRLRVSLKTRFTDKSGRRDFELLLFFERAATTP